MSYLGKREDCKSDSKAADMQIDDLNSTSPILKGSSEAGMAPMSGPNEFTKERTRTKFVGNQGGMRREFPAEGVTAGATQSVKE